MADREQGPIEILCKEIGFRFDPRMETDAILVSLVRVLVDEVATIREFAVGIVGLTGKMPSNDSGEVLQCVVKMLLSDASRAALIGQSAATHDFIHEAYPDDTYPADHLIDMLSSCVSAIRFGLERPCHSRHAAEASNHIWKHKYGVSLFDSFTPAWQKDWARAMLQEAILRLGIAHISQS